MLNWFKKKDIDSVKLSWDQHLSNAIQHDIEYMKEKANLWKLNYKKEVVDSYYPYLTIQSNLDWALDLAFTHSNKDLLSEYLLWNVSECEEILNPNHPNWASKWKDLNKLIKSKVLVYYNYSYSWYHNTDIDFNEIKINSVNLLDHYLKFDNKNWDESSQSSYITYILDLIISGDIEVAKKYININKKFKWVEKFHSWVVIFVNQISSQKNGDSLDLNITFDEPFNIIRDFNWKIGEEYEYQTGNYRSNLWYISNTSNLIRLRFAILRWIYIEKKEISGNWDDILKQIN